MFAKLTSLFVLNIYLSGAVGKKLSSDYFRLLFFVVLCKSSVRSIEEKVMESDTQYKALFVAVSCAYFQNTLIFLHSRICCTRQIQSEVYVKISE